MKAQNMLKNEQARALRSALRGKFKNLIFREVCSVNAKPENLRQIRVYSPNHGTPYYRVVESSNGKNCEKIYSQYTFITSRARIRPNDQYREEIVGLSNNARYYDFTEGCNFEFVSVGNNLPPPPKVGDIVCGEVLPKQAGKNVMYGRWFICSRQFLLMWTAIMYDTHEIFKGKIGNDLKCWFETALTTNNHLRWVLNKKMTNEPIPKEEDERLFKLINTERASKKYVDVYNAIILLALYGEFPTLNNIPKGEPKLRGWTVPPSLIRNLLKMIPNFNPCEFFEEKFINPEDAMEKLTTLGRADNKKQKLPVVVVAEVVEEKQTQQKPENLWARIAALPPKPVEVVKEPEVQVKPREEDMAFIDDDMEPIDWGDVESSDEDSDY